MCADQYRHRYVLANIVPADAVWGGYDQSYLTYRGGKTLTAVFVARIMRVTYFDTDAGGPQRCQQLKFRTFRDPDKLAIRSLTYGKSQPSSGK